MPQTSQPAPGVNGLAVLAVIVVVGLVTGAGFYRYKRRQMDAELAIEMAAAPKTPEERLALWLRLSGPQIHHRLAVVGRFAPEQPWLVTHAIARPDGPPELWGIDCSALPHDLARQDGLTIVVELPAPRMLARAPLEDQEGNRVPLYPPDAQLDPAKRLEELSLYLLEGIPGALARDIPGSALVIHVARE